MDWTVGGDNLCVHAWFLSKVTTLCFPLKRPHTELRIAFLHDSISAFSYLTDLIKVKILGNFGEQFLSSQVEFWNKAQHVSSTSP